MVGREGWPTQRPGPDEAAPTVIATYLGAYGPATPEVFDRWLSLNGTSKPRLRRWFESMGDAVTEVEELLPKEHRAAVSRTSGWISPIVVVDGRVVGVWEILGDEVQVTPFPNGARLPLKELRKEAAHVARATGVDRLTVRIS